MQEKDETAMKLSTILHHEAHLPLLYMLSITVCKAKVNFYQYTHNINMQFNYRDRIHLSYDHAPRPSANT